MNNNYQLKNYQSDPYAGYSQEPQRKSENESSWSPENSVDEQSFIRPKKPFPLPQTPPFPQNSNSLKRKQPNQNFTPQEESHCVQMVKKKLLNWSFPEPALQSVSVSSPITSIPILSHKHFNKCFNSKTKLKDVDMVQYLALHRSQGGSLGTYGVGPCLALSVKTVDANGRAVFSILGHFSHDILAFIQGSPTNKITELLNHAFTLCPSSEVTMAGMYDQEQFEAVKRRIIEIYNPPQLNEYFNPWKIPGERLKSKSQDAEDLAVYLTERGPSLRIAITAEGETFVADDDPHSSFSQFSEEDFEEWKAKRPPAVDVQAEPASLEQLKPQFMQIIQDQEFDSMFPSEEVHNLNIDEWQFTLDEQNHRLMTKGVASCLAIGVRCFDPEGRLMFCGLGHFGNVEHAGYIQEFLDQAASSCATFEVFAAGLHSEEDFKEVQSLIEEYRPTKIEAVINPWKIPRDLHGRKDQSSLEFYICNWGASLKMGITSAGEICIADEPISPSVSSEFLQFSEEAFEAWKLQKRAEQVEQKE